MATVVREIDGIRGFCEYHNGEPYTYIYTRDAIEMLGLFELRGKYKMLRLKSFGEKFMEVIKEIGDKIDLNKTGMNITPNFKISQVSNDDTITEDQVFDKILENTAYASCCVNNNSKAFWKNSKYDDILPEFILDRVIFAIANKLRNKKAEDFRFHLIWNVIPHFQQTATQDQINQVPILNQTSKFMYDDTNYSTVTVQQYNFAKQTIEFHINRISILTNSPTTEDTIFALLKDFDCALQNNNEVSLETITNKYMQTLRKVIGVNPDQYTIFDTLDAIIGNRRIYMIFICYMINTIRELENEKIRNAYGMQEEFIEYNGHCLRGISCIDKDILMKDSPVEFLSVEDKYDLDHINECRKYTFEDLINGKKD